ncbi:fumarylacetoacetate hydrolase family protein [Crenobacter sp. SG2303]|uniref:Fumarylacetoacetate hydrolase family protein n=1 Tax=Crenobacter oryzisoli TaxID=3056844 RepID=A0ABT7XJG6_9NEIS|nr:fumarylacetoacetate hydrolase family protein [Crenobacter sp. SG2303]MDN0073915.1 fumarylacetoacetate hydrolase family protein [Crenobacter sp. SG2303]
MDAALLNTLGDELFAALRGRHTLAPLTERHPAISVDDAYRISTRFLERRLAEGEKVIGKKIGVTSSPVQEMLNVHQPDFGFLTDAMALWNDAIVDLAEQRLIAPRIEGEIAFVLKQDISGTTITREDILDATECVLPCFEVVDSRIDDWRIRIQDTVADNASCGVYVLGQGSVAPRALDLAEARLTMRRNGVEVATGLGSAVQGHPAEAVAWLANTLGRFGIPFLAGEVILSGSLVPLVPVVAGDHFDLDIAGIGSAAVRFI